MINNNLLLSHHIQMFDSEIAGWYSVIKNEFDSK